MGPSTLGSVREQGSAGRMVDWLRTAPTATTTCYVVHGELGASSALARDIQRDLGWCAVVPLR